MERYNIGFWIITLSMTVMGLAFGAAGIIQFYMPRGLGIDFLTVQGSFLGGLGFFIGVLIYIYDVLKIATQKN